MSGVTGDIWVDCSPGANDEGYGVPRPPLVQEPMPVRWGGTFIGSVLLAGAVLQRK